MKTISCILFSAIILVSCGTEKKKDNAQSLNTAFESYKEGLILRFWEMYPGWASSVGYHNFDSMLNVPDDNQRQKELKFVKAELDSLNLFIPDSLNDNNRTDFYLIKNQLNASVWSLKEMKSFEWDPSNYNIGSTFGDMLNNTYDSLDNRLRNFYLRMKNIPAYFEAAKKNIRNPTKEHTQLAIDQNTGSLGVFERDLKDALNRSGLNEDEKKKMSLLIPLL